MVRVKSVSTEVIIQTSAEGGVCADVQQAVAVVDGLDDAHARPDPVGNGRRGLVQRDGRLVAAVERVLG